MRSIRLSTQHPKTPLRQILEYGVEALGNRRKELILIGLVFLLLPQLLLALAWAYASTDAVMLLQDWASKPPLDLIEIVWGTTVSRVAPAFFLSFLMGLIGILALARTCVDYFESRPATFGDIILRALRTLFTKGLGAGIFLIILLPVLSLMPLLRAVALSLLVMLPVTLVSSPHGGFRTSWDTLFLKYAMKTRFGRWPVFINILSVSGLFLTVMFALSFLIEASSIADTWLGLPAGIFETELNLIVSKISFGALFSKLLTIFWNSLWLALLMPFAAAALHISTIPGDHVTFEAEA